MAGATRRWFRTQKSNTCYRKLCGGTTLSGKPSTSSSGKSRAITLLHAVAHSYHQIYLQTVFAVKYRNAVLLKAWRTELLAVIGNLINETGCKTILVNGVEDHVHCLVGLRPAVSVSELMKIVKAKSSKYINDHGLTPERFEWQEGYGVFSYSHSDIDRVYRYIKNQETHHQRQSLQEEYIELLQEYPIAYQPEFVFKDPISQHQPGRKRHPPHC